MITVEEIERAVQSLPPEKLAEFKDWFDMFASEVWDQHFEEDVLAGRLDRFADEALRELDAGHCTEL